jgi:hypothetical protein
MSTVIDNPRLISVAIELELLTMCSVGLRQDLAMSVSFPG